MTIFQQIQALTRQLLPTGRAWRTTLNGWHYTLIQALAISETKAFTDATGIYDSLLPDNANFTVDDASAWEGRLGMIQSTAPLAIRMQAILQKMNYPGQILGRQHYLCLQSMLQLAGFNVWVYENIFQPGNTTQNPVTVFGGGGEVFTQYNNTGLQYGQKQYGGQWGDVIANSIDPGVDATFNIGSNLRATFFICGPTLGAPAYIPAIQRSQFRQLVLQLKRVTRVAYVNAVYV